MRIPKVSVILAMALGTGSAYALPPTAVTDINLVVAGSSVLRDTVLQEFASICFAGTLNQYRASPTNNQDFRAASCTVVNTGVPAAIANKNAILYYRSEGDSVYGVGPLAKNLVVKRLLVNASCSVAVPPAVGDCPVSGYNLATDSGLGNIVNSRVDLGISEMEPPRFAGENWPPSGTSALGVAPTGAQLGSVSFTLARAIIFGLAVNSAFPENTLSPGQAAGIFAGVYGDWSQLPPLPEAPITVCRGRPGAGVQAAASVYFERAECGGPYLPFVTAPAAPLYGNPVIEGDANGVAACVANDPNSIGFLRYTTTPPAGTKWLQLRTFAPGKPAVVARNYDFWYEATFNKDEWIAARPLENTLADFIANRIRTTLPVGLPGQLALSFNPPGPDTAPCTYSGNSCGLCL